MSEAKHHQAAFINAIAEEGSKTEAVRYLQTTWNELCEEQNKTARLRAERDRLREALARMGDIIDARSELFASDEELLLNLKDTVNITLKETDNG